ncbi:MAG: LysR family transcriptional regulator [Clostridiales bacterium]|nr:LysR family transcriptional regulator [Clostridiales bacterium]MDY3745560.1 LysR family transcriptional regulator [Lachnospiraceae bacterium]
MQSILSDINIQQIINFVTIVELHGFQAASDHLHMTQSAVSKSIGRLEETLGFPLFVKEHKGSRVFRDSMLTEQGQYLYKYWAPALNEIENAYRHIITVSENANRTINIAYASASNPDTYLWPLLEKIQEDHKDFCYNLESAYRSELIRGLLDESYDIIFVPDIEYYSINHTTMNYRYLAIDNVQVIVPRNSHLFDRDSLTIEDIRNEHFLIFEDGRSESPKLTFQRFCKSVDMNPPTTPLQKDGFNIANAYRTSSGLAFIDSYFRLEDTKNFKTIPLEGYYNGVLCVWRKNIHKKKLINQFLKYFPDLSDKTEGKKPLLQK